MIISHIIAINIVETIAIEEIEIKYYISLKIYQLRETKLIIYKNSLNKRNYNKQSNSDNKIHIDIKKRYLI